MKNKKTLSWIGTIFFTILGLVYIAPIIIVLFNSNCYNVIVITTKNGVNLL